MVNEIQTEYCSSRRKGDSPADHTDLHGSLKIKSCFYLRLLRNQRDQIFLPHSSPTFASVNGKINLKEETNFYHPNRKLPEIIKVKSVLFISFLRETPKLLETGHFLGKCTLCPHDFHRQNYLKIVTTYQNDMVNGLSN